MQASTDLDRSSVGTNGGISMLTPEQVHFGRADNVIARRTTVLNTAWHPEDPPGGRLDQSSHHTQDSPPAEPSPLPPKRKRARAKEKSTN